MDTIARLCIAATCYLVLAAMGVTIVDVAMPSTVEILLPGGVVQTLRQDAGIYVETWFMGAPVIIVTLPVQALYDVLLGACAILLGIEYWLLWRCWKHDSMDA